MVLAPGTCCSTKRSQSRCAVLSELTVNAPAAVWQHPFVSVFKLGDVENWSNVAKQGDVVSVLVCSSYPPCLQART